MKKWIVCGLIILGLFFYRDEISQSYRRIAGPEKPQAFGWLQAGNKKIDLAIEQADIDSSLLLLSGLQEKVVREIEKPSGGSDDTESRHNYRRQLICELAVIYRKMALQFLQKGDELNYVHHMELSSEEVTKCASFEIVRVAP